MSKANYHVTILTAKDYISPADTSEYTQNVLLEDGLLQKALESRGLQVNRVAWDDPEFDWTSTQYAIFKTTWDYFDRAEEFYAWLKMVKTQTQLINPIETIYWNMDKRYLLDLEAKGINIVDTYLIEQGDTRTLQQLVELTGWQKSILKPAISGAARHTYKLNADNIAEHEEAFAKLSTSETMLLQPFQDKVLSKGEVSHMVFGGKYSHSVLKKAKPGDFRVQDDFGGTVHAYTASAEEIALAERITHAVDALPIYARVDLLWDNKDELALAELELLEPELWLREKEGAADMLADAVLLHIQD